MISVGQLLRYLGVGSLCGEVCKIFTAETPRTRRLRREKLDATRGQIRFSQHPRSQILNRKDHVRYGLFFKRFLFAAWIVSGSLAGSRIAFGTEITLPETRFADEHSKEKLSAARPDTQVSDLTSSVAARLPHTGTPERRS